MSYRSKPRCQCCGQVLRDPYESRYPVYWRHCDDNGKIDAVRIAHVYFNPYIEWYDGWIDTSEELYTEDLNRLCKRETVEYVSDEWHVIKATGTTLDDEAVYVNRESEESDG